MNIYRERDIPFIDFANNLKYVWFKDGRHMNERDATEFTRDLIGCVKNKMLQ